MKRLFKAAAVAIAGLLLSLTPIAAAAEKMVHHVGEDGEHFLAIQVSDNLPGTWTKVLNNAANVSRAYSDAGKEVTIRIVAYNAGLHMFREDTSTVLDRLQSFDQSMPNVSFVACGNTIAGMTKQEGAAPPIVEFAEVVPGGIVELITLNEQGWTIIRP